MQKIEAFILNVGTDLFKAGWVEALWNGEDYEVYLYEIRPDDDLKIRLIIHASGEKNENMIVKSAIHNQGKIIATSISNEPINASMKIANQKKAY